MSAIYDRLGVGYTRRRQPDPRIARQIGHLFGDARTVVNVGAGTGCYEPIDRYVIAVEPSAVMVAQRASGGAPTVRAVAEALPFADRAFDASLASLTIHHWPEWRAGVTEMRRVTRERIVVFHFDLDHQHTFWLAAEYLPEALGVPAPGIAEVCDAVGGAQVEVVPVPIDCTDGFLCAYWGRPEAYLEAEVRAAISTFHLLDPAVCERAVDALARDLASGAWDDRHGELRRRTELDCGYRLIVADIP